MYKSVTCLIFTSTLFFLIVEFEYLIFNDYSINYRSCINSNLQSSNIFEVLKQKATDILQFSTSLFFID